MRSIRPITRSWRALAGVVLALSIASAAPAARASVAPDSLQFRYVIK